MAKTSGLVLLALCMAFLWSPVRAASASVAEEVNPCRSATVTATAGDSYLDLVYHVSLSNPTGHAAGLTLLEHIEFLEKVEGVTDDLVLNRQGEALLASVPSGWEGEIVIRAKAKIIDLGQSGTRSAVVALPPAVSRSMEFDLPGRNVGLEFPRDERLASPPGMAMVTSLGTAGERSRFSVVPLSGDLFQPEWRPIPPPRPAGYSLRETHRITEDVPAYADDVTLEFAFAGTPPAAVRANLPTGVTISRVLASDGGRWKIAGGLLEITVPEGFAGDHLTLRCRLDGASTSEDAGAQLLAVPLFGSPEAERHTGTVTVNGGRHELAFSVLEGARQTAAEGWRLACEFEVHPPLAGRGSPAVRVAVRVVPMAVRRVATVETHYAVSEYRIVGTHRVSLKTEGEQTTALTLLLPPATTARAVTGDVRDWSQEGGTVRIEPAARPGAVPKVEVTTESLTGGRLKLELAPPTVAEATSSEYFMAVTHVPEVQLKTALAEAAWRVTPDALPAWLRQLSPPVAYHYRDAAPAVELEALPVEAELRGTVQDHVAVSADRVQRDTLFLIDIQKRAVSQVELLLQPGFTAESVEGPYVESWDVGPIPEAVATDGSRVTVRFPGPLTGGIHFRLVSSGSAPTGPLSLFGVRLSGAPALHGWLGIGADVSTRVRPMEDGRTNLASVRTDQAPAYLAGFGNRFVYEFYSTDWQLDLAAEGVPPVYDAEVLNVLSFSASGVEASAFVNVKVTQGGLAELELRVPAGAATPQMNAPDAVMVRWSEGVGLVRFRGPKTGAFTLRVDYTLPTGAAAADLNVEPVRVTGAKSESGVLLLVQARPDVDVKAAEPPRALQPAEAEQQYPGWSYRREHPALAAYGYRDADWRLPVSVAAHPLSEQMLQAIIPLAKLDTLVQDGGETLNHLRLFVTNTTQQFLTVDLAKLDPQARLIGTYVYGEPVKPFRQGKTVLELPLFANETAARVGMSVIDITYAAPTSSLATMRRSSYELPDLGLNVGKVEWTVRLPQDYRLTAVGGNLDKPVAGPPPVRGLAARLVAPAADFVQQNGRALLAVAIGIALLVGFVIGLRHVSRVLKRPTWSVIWQTAVVILILAVLAGMMMPALSRPRYASKVSAEQNDLHQVGMAIQMYRNDHNGSYAPSLDALVEGGYIGSPDILKSPVEPEAQLVYVPPSPDAPPTEVVAYFWHPRYRQATLLFVDGAVTTGLPDSEGNLVNPRMAAPPIAAASALAAAPGASATAPAPAAGGFGGAAVKTEELAEALQLGQQMAQQRGAPTVNQPVDTGRLNQALIAANADRVKDALDRYAKEHGGQQPGSAQDLSSYIADARLRQAVAEAMSMPALSRARYAAKISKEQTNMHQIGVAVSMYLQRSKGDYPPDLQTLIQQGYLDDPGILTSPQGPEVQLIYTPPAKDAKPTDVVAYFWDPRDNHANLVFVDGAVQQAGHDAAGNLMNPRNGAFIRRGAAQAEQQAAGDQLARSRYSLGNAYMQRGDYDEAEKQFSDALKLDAGNDEARRGLDQLRALRSEVKDQQMGAMVMTKPAPEQAAPAAPMSKRTAAKGASDLKSIEKQLEEREMAYKAVGPQGGATAVGTGLALAAAAQAPAPTAPEARPTAGYELWSVDRELLPAVAGPAAPPAQQELPALQPRLGKASLVRQVAGGRSIGALPIPIDFPAPATVSYEFVKPFLGRAEASVSFRVLRTGSVMLLELVLAAAALIGYALLRRRAPRAGAGYAAIALAVSFAGMAAAPATFASAFGAAALAMGVCLAAEVIHLTFLHIHAMRTGS